MTPDFYFGLNFGEDLIYDVEVYPNVFMVSFMAVTDDREWYFEISEFQNDFYHLMEFVEVCRNHEVKWVGFNNLGYDYPMMHFICRTGHWIDPQHIYQKNMDIINTPFQARFSHMVWDSDQLVPQIDLYKIHHFDNVSKATSLKVLEFNMGMDSIEEAPFPFGTELTEAQIKVLRGYNRHDVQATKKFYHYSKVQLDLRRSLSLKFDENMMNYSDVKIGERILVNELEKAGVELYDWSTGKKKKRQTFRDQIALKDVIFPYVELERVEFQNIRRLIENKVITGDEVTANDDGEFMLNTKGIFTDLVASVHGLEYTFGTGGLHASVESQILCSNETHVLVDVDVASYYPFIGIKNSMFPLHLGESFCPAYQGVANTRQTYTKGTPENEAYKLGLNAVYGNSNNRYSVFLDTFYTMTTTINGQLLLCMLIEQLLKVPGLTMVQANTDGVTYYCPREYLDFTRELQKWWMDVTQLKLEEVLYRRMFIRDVNSYIAEKEDGKLKRIGAYAHETALENPGTRELPWHKDWSARVVAKAAEAALVRGEDIREFIEHHIELQDFLLRTKVPKSSHLEWAGVKVGNVVRYYVSTDGYPLEKVMPPAGPEGAYKRANGIKDHYYAEVLAEVGNAWDERIHTKNKSTYTERRIGINTGWNVDLCNKIPTNDVYYYDINYEWYIGEAEKLVNNLVGQNDFNHLNRLWYHPESEGYLRCISGNWQNTIDGSLCVDVTGKPEHEAAAKRQGV